MLEFKPRDLWIGAYWKRGSHVSAEIEVEEFDCWVCVIPCVPLHLAIRWITNAESRRDLEATRRRNNARLRSWEARQETNRRLYGTPSATPETIE